MCLLYFVAQQLVLRPLGALLTLLLPWTHTQVWAVVPSAARPDLSHMWVLVDVAEIVNVVLEFQSTPPFG